MAQRSGAIPWIEKYRPSKFEDIVLSHINQRLFRNILEKNYFPNLLFYGPPGTGKTTTILNLINAHQLLYSRINKSNVIHLNASDERGIDVVRTHINQFVSSMNLFEPAVKFVILDEVDYMTKNAQQALKHILQSSFANVRICLVCNYVSRIDESLKNEFVCVRFNQLPKEDIFKFIRKVSSAERVDIEDDAIVCVQNTYGSDIRGMINFIQLNQGLAAHEWTTRAITPDTLELVHGALFADDPKRTVEIIHEVSVACNADIATIIKRYVDHVIRNHDDLVVPKFMDAMQIAIHNRDCACDAATIEFVAAAMRALAPGYANVARPDNSATL